jgi:hypothetical protein
MPRRAQSNADQKPKRPRREGETKQRKSRDRHSKERTSQQRTNKQQIDMFALMLQVQTLSLMLDDVRSRLSQIETRLGIDRVTQTDRANLSNLDRAV